MSIFNISGKMLIIFFCLLASSMANAGILWERELTADANTNSGPLAFCLNKDANGVIVTTIECPKGSFPIKGDNILWEIKADGNATRILPKNTDGSKVWTNAIPVGPGCAIASDSAGNILTIGILSKQKGEKGQKIGIISKSDGAERTVSPANSIESHSIRKMISLQDDTFVLVGDQNSDGLLLLIDKQGKTLREEKFDSGRYDIFSDSDWIKTNNPHLVVVGVSFNQSSEPNTGIYGDNFILLYDPNLKMVHEDYFTGWKSISAVASAAMPPKVCYLDNGNIVVLYNKQSAESEDPNKTKVWARCYTQEMKLLWDKEIFEGDSFPNKIPFHFYLIKYGSKGFVSVKIKPAERLEFYYFDESGSKIGYYEYKGLVGTPGFNIIRMSDKIIAVFEEFSGEGNIKNITIKTKVIALD
jgi:hypothetical protein